MKKISVWVKKVSAICSLLTIVCLCAPGLAFGLTWSSLTPMPTARGYLSVVAADGLLYGLGGNNGSLINDVQAYNPGTDSWAWKAPLLNYLCQGAAGVINHKIYLAGGYAYLGGGSYKNINYLQIYDIGTNAWSYGAAMPVSSNSTTAGVIDGKLYVQISNSGEFYSYDTAANTWTSKAKAPVIHNNAGAGVIDGKFYVAGGNIGTGATNRVDVYDPVTNTWTQRAAMRVAREGMASGVWNGLLYVAGGGNPSGQLSEVEVYDPSTDSWADATNMLTARLALGGAVIDGNFYALGGWNSGYVNTLEAGAVPLPGAAWLLGSGLLGLVGWRRFRKN